MKNKIQFIIFAVLVIFTLLFFASHFDNDGWFLLNSGRYVEQFGIPHVEPFTIHKNFHFVMHQWLFDLGLWKLYKLGGLKAMLAYNWVISAVFLFVYSRLIKLKIGQLSGAVRLFLLLWFLLMSMRYLFQRPQTMSGLIFLLEIYLLEKYASQSQMPRVLIPVFFLLSVLLINLHGAMWPMFTVFLLPYACEGLLGPRFPFGRWELTWSARDFLFLFMAVMAGGFCNPYGTEAMTYAFKSYGYPEINSLVTEMHPLTLNFTYPYMTATLILLFFLYCHLCPPFPSPPSAAFGSRYRIYGPSGQPQYYAFFTGWSFSYGRNHSQLSIQENCTRFLSLVSCPRHGRTHNRSCRGRKLRSFPTDQSAGRTISAVHGQFSCVGPADSLGSMDIVERA